MLTRLVTYLLAWVCLGLAACGGGERNVWEDFRNDPYEQYPLTSERKLPPAGEPRVPQGVATDDPAFFPVETQSREYRTPGFMAANGFTHGVVMINAAMVYPWNRGYTSLIEIRSMAIICRDRKSGLQTVQAEIRVGREEAGGQGGFKWETYHRGPGWFTSGIAQTKITPVMTDIAAAMDLSANPAGIFHAWTNPRFELSPDCDYLVEVWARITGDALLQVGMDGWKGPWADYNGYSDGCRTSMNCQAFLGDWWGDTSGKFQKFRAPLRF